MNFTQLAESTMRISTTATSETPFRPMVDIHPEQLFQTEFAKFDKAMISVCLG